MAVEPKRRLITVDEYHRMAEEGILGPDERVELLDGQIFKMTPISPRHAGCVNRLMRLFIQRLGNRATVSGQHPVVLDDLSEPEPDLSIARWRDDDYSSAHPRPVDIYLLIEVARTSLTIDRVRSSSATREQV